MARRRARRSNQPRFKGGRDPLFSCVLPDTRRAIHAKAYEFNVSPSWVVATILADAMGVTEQVSYQTNRKAGER